MKKYRKNLILALVCFLIVIVLNFFLPRLLPGNPIAYLTGFSEEDMTPAQVAYYRQALHLAAFFVAAAEPPQKTDDRAEQHGRQGDL